MKRFFFLSLILGVCVVGFVPNNSSAGTISINSTLAPVENEGRQGFEISVGNSGDEAAKNIQVHAELDGETQSGPVWDTLKNGDNRTHRIYFDKLPQTPGTYPVFITIDFADLNLYPFTALDLATLDVGEGAARSRLFGKAEPVEIGKKGRVRFTLKNLDKQAKTVSVRVFGPRELNVAGGDITLQLAEEAEASESIPVSNFSAQPGASYPLFLVFTYEQDGRKFAYSLRTRVSIGAGGLSLSVRKIVVYAGAGVLALAVVIEVARRVRRRKRI